MMDMGFDKSRWTMDTSGLWLCLRVDDPQAARRLCDSMEAAPDKKYRLEIKETRKKRSLDANAYFWVLCGKLAAVLHMTTTEIYRWCVREIGDNFQIVPIRADAFEEWERIWEGHGAGWIVDDLGECRNIPGFHYAKSYYGSSLYDSAQMSRLIDLVVETCKEQDIPTATPDEIEEMKARWTEYEQTHKGAGDSSRGEKEGQ